MGKRCCTLEELVTFSMNKTLSSYAGKKILVTGHTGFKGSWFSRILVLAGAEVYGLALSAEPESLFARIEKLGLQESTILDIRNRQSVDNYFKENRFDGIFHMAAQPLVRRSYKEPIETFDTNVMGTAHILNSVINHQSSKWVVVITTDKVYKNFKKLEGYSEDEPLGGNDPYSASKASAEFVVTAWRTITNQSKNKVLICSARAGNVIGGGDSAEDRLLPDLIRGFKSNSMSIIRNPNSIRPWQHVLDPLYGYLLIGSMLMKNAQVSLSYNFGPGEKSKLTVEQVSSFACSLWPESKGFEVKVSSTDVPESEFLWLSSVLAGKELGWKNSLDAQEAIRWTIDWEKKTMLESPLKIMDEQIAKFYSIGL